MDSALEFALSHPAPCASRHDPGLSHSTVLDQPSPMGTMRHEKVRHEGEEWAMEHGDRVPEPSCPSNDKQGILFVLALRWVGRSSPFADRRLTAQTPPKGEP